MIDTIDGKMTIKTTDKTNKRIFHINAINIFGKKRYEAYIIKRFTYKKPTNKYINNSISDGKTQQKAAIKYYPAADSFHFLER
jgi:hypothetical protein